MKTLKLTGLLLLSLSMMQASANRVHRDDITVEVVNARGWELPTFNTRTASRSTLRKAYVEATPGQRYGIRVTNHTSERLGLVIAVDGRNIISGKRSNLASGERKYVLGPRESAVYDGWRTGRNRINEFYFTREDDAYAAAFGDYSAMGVIAVATFKERHVQPRYLEDHYSTRKQAPQAKSGNSDRYRSAPGTGYGQEQYSRSRRVEFDAKRRAAATHLFKYEWSETLCEMGVTRCYTRHNRLWRDDRRYSSRGYAPPPPNYRAYRQTYH